MVIAKKAALGVSLLFCFATAQALDWGEILKQATEPQQDQQQNAPSNFDLLKEGIGVLAGSAGIKETEEIAIGQQIAGNLLGAAPLVKDAQLQRYINHVGRWVASQSERPDLEWHFGVIESRDINAFAAPGGYIFVTRGLYVLLQNEAELAGVLGHEIGHVVRKHHLNILQQSRMVSLGGKLLARKAGDNQNVQKVIGSGAEIVARGLDKDAEFEADRIGMVLASRAGYDAFGLPEVLQQIGHAGSEDGSSVALLFKTHPRPDERLTKLDEVVDARFDDAPGQMLAGRFYKLKQ